MTKDAKPHAGGCYCGGVRYEAEGKLGSAVFCHCGQCRKMTGYVLASCGASLDNFTITKDETLTWYASTPEAERGFCGRCGSPLFWRGVGGASISFTIGSLDHNDHMASAGHIFAADKGDWYAITDDLPQYEQGDGGVLRVPEHDPI